MTLTVVAFQDYFKCHKLLYTRANDIESLTVEDDYGNEIGVAPSIIDDQLAIDFIVEACEHKSEELHQAKQLGKFSVWCSALDTLTPVSGISLDGANTVLQTWSKSDSPGLASLAIFGASALGLMDIGIIITHVKFGDRLIPFNDEYIQFVVDSIRDIRAKIDAEPQCSGKVPGCIMPDCCKTIISEHTDYVGL